MQKKQARYMKQAKEEYVKAGVYIQKAEKKNGLCSNQTRNMHFLCIKSQRLF